MTLWVSFQLQMMHLNPFPIGETIVTWTATDVGGNTSSIEQKITIFDTIFPILQVPEDIVLEATSLEHNEVNLSEATATDNGEIASITNDAPEFFPLGETTVTWTATDSSNKFLKSYPVSFCDRY